MNMWSYQMYFSGGQEHFEYDPWGGRGSAATQRSYPYLESLLSFLELDCAQVEGQLQDILTCWNRFFSTGDSTHGDEAMAKMGELAARHIYFQLPYLQWFTHKAAGTLAPEMTKELLQLLEQLPVYQRQAQAFIEVVLDIDRAGRDTQRSMSGQYRINEPDAPALFQFQAISVGFGSIGEEMCGSILQPNTIRDLIDFSLRECVTSGTSVRRCRNCGRYFPLTRRVTAEYCERPNADRKPCRNTGAVQKWTENRKDDVVFKEYRREYKRHFAWIRAGKLSAEEFADWSKRAQAKKKDCEDGKISLDDLKTWMKNS